MSASAVALATRLASNWVSKLCTWVMDSTSRPALFSTSSSSWALRKTISGWPCHHLVAGLHQQLSPPARPPARRDRSCPSAPPYHAAARNRGRCRGDTVEMVRLAAGTRRLRSLMPAQQQSRQQQASKSTNACEPQRGRAAGATRAAMIGLSITCIMTLIVRLRPSDQETSENSDLMRMAQARHCGRMSGNGQLADALLPGLRSRSWKSWVRF